jgi:N-acetylated-alpha-linked acidic dipeptidase
MNASPSFAHLVRDTAKLVSHPTVVGSTLWDARTDQGKFYGNISNEAITQINAETDAEIAGSELSDIRPLGSGGDYTVFLQRIGVRLLPTHRHTFGPDLFP